jgi:hypothetical protein
MPRILFFGNLPQTRFTLEVLSCLIPMACFLVPTKAAGPLSVCLATLGFFSIQTAVYLTGVQLNNNPSDRSDKAVLDSPNFLQQYDHTFVCLWAWEQAA